MGMDDNYEKSPSYKINPFFININIKLIIAHT